MVTITHKRGMWYVNDKNGHLLCKKKTYLDCEMWLTKHGYETPAETKQFKKEMAMARKSDKALYKRMADDPLNMRDEINRAFR